VAAATECLLSGDVTAADVLVRGDAPFDELAEEVEALAERQLTLQTPIGADLRHLPSVLRMVPRTGALCRPGRAHRGSGGERAHGAVDAAAARLVEQMGRVT
jgi:hypothetical protein